MVASHQSSDDVTISAVAFDDDPESATYYGGPFGKRILVLEPDPLLTTRDMCRAKAELTLERRRYPERELDLTFLPNPALEPDDVVQITMLDGTVENHLIRSLNFPLSAGTWTAATISTAVADDLPTDVPTPGGDPDEPRPEDPEPPADPETDTDEEDAQWNSSAAQHPSSCFCIPKPDIRHGHRNDVQHALQAD